MLVSCQCCIICHPSSVGLTNISPGYLRLKSPILLVSWLPLSEDAGVTEIGQIGIMTEREEREPLRPECSQSEQETRKHPRAVSQSANILYEQKKIFAENIDTDQCPHPCHNADNGNTQRWSETRGLCLGSCAIMRAREQSWPLIGQNQESSGFWLADEGHVPRPNEDPSLPVRMEIMHDAWTCKIIKF